MSLDDGKEWKELTASLSPKKEWIGTVLASKYDEATVYVAQQGRYDEDFAVRLYKSTDYGKTFKSIAGNLPGGPINMIREDPVSPNVLYAANDFGVYVTTERRRAVGRARRQSAVGQRHGLHRAPARPHARHRDARPRRVDDRRESDSEPIARRRGARSTDAVRLAADPSAPRATRARTWRERRRQAR